MSRILGLDVSTKTIGIAIFEDKGNHGKLQLLTHITPQVKPKPKDNIELLMKKAQTFESEFLEKYSDIEIGRVFIEEPLLRSNNVNTVATLLRFNGMICKSIYEVLNIVPDFISSYDARKYAFPDLMGIRHHKKNGDEYTTKELEKKTPVLFGGYPYDIDKKMVIFDKVSERESQIVWIYNKHQKLTKENFDMTDAYSCVLGGMRKCGSWQ
tara:strand:- start:1079 stop:1711 length:633 start_codon:yes stop_codon:yes gene_type:complete